MGSTGHLTTRPILPAVTHWSVVAGVRPLHALVTAPGLLFLVTLTIMLFHPPDVRFHSLDRVAFVVLIFVAALRALALRKRINIAIPAMWPMAALLSLGLVSLLAQPYEAQDWSVFDRKMGSAIRAVSRGRFGVRRRRIAAQV